MCKREVKQRSRSPDHMNGKGDMKDSLFL